MKREFWAEFDLYGKVTPYGFQIYKLLQEEQEARKTNDKGKEQKKRKEREDLQSKVQEIIGSFLFQGKLGAFTVHDSVCRQMLLAQFLPADVICEGRSTQCKDYAKGKNGLQQWYYGGDIQNPRGNFQEFLCRRARWMASILGLVNQEVTVAPVLPNLSLFPAGAWAVQITFTLRKPYISKDDVDFYILDNPVKKEWVFKVPYVAPSQWKGALRATMVRELAEENTTLNDDAWIERRLQLIRLFGNEKGVRIEDERFEAYLDKLRPDAAKTYRERLKKLTPTGFLAGRLHFYPTFFDKIGLEVINPHDRETGAGKHPIYFECVPAGTKGVFTLLYVPMDAGPADENTCQDDLRAIAQSIHAMLTKYGLGAKTSSGYGVADVNQEEIQVQPEAWHETFMREWGMEDG